MNYLDKRVQSLRDKNYLNSHTKKIPLQYEKKKKKSSPITIKETEFVVKSF